MNNVYITTKHNEINQLLDSHYPSPRSKSKAVMQFIVRHERKERELIDYLLNQMFKRKEDEIVRIAALRATFRYQIELPSWGRLLYESSWSKMSLLTGLLTEATFIRYLLGKRMMNSLKETRTALTIEVNDWLVTVGYKLGGKKFSVKDLKMVELKNYYANNKFFDSSTNTRHGETKLGSIKIYISGVAEPLRFSSTEYTEASLITVHNALTDLLKKKG